MLIGLFQDYSVGVAEIPVGARDDALSGRQSFENLVVLRILAPDLYVAQGGCRTVFADHEHLISSGALEESAARNQKRPCRLAELEVDIESLPDLDVFRTRPLDSEVGPECAVGNLGIELADDNVVFRAVALDSPFQPRLDAVDVMLVDFHCYLIVVENVYLPYLLACGNVLAEFGGQVAELAGVRRPDVEIVGPLPDEAEISCILRRLSRIILICSRR